MRLLSLLLVMLMCGPIASAEPTPATVHDATKAIIELKAENAQLLKMVERLTEAVARLEQLQGEAADVPEVAISRKVPGQWVMEPQTGVPVYARSQWIVRQFGPCKVVELVRDGITPVPVGAVFYGNTSGPAQPQAIPATQSSDRLYQQSQRLRP